MFYGELFGWSFADQKPMSDGGPDAMAQLNGKNVGGVMSRSAEQKKMNVPPHWVSYVAADDAKATAANAAKLNATVLMEAHDVGPTGAVFGILQPAQR